MSVSNRLKRSLRRSLSRLHRDRPALLTFLFHSLFEDQQEIDRDHVDPQQCVTRQHMRTFLGYFQEAGYRFAHPEQLKTGLDPAGRYVLVSFDDGYYNNLRMLDLMEEFQAPALFFVTTGNIQRAECFWWDVVYREMRRQGKGRAEISARQKSLKNLHHREILAQLTEQFGADCLQPWSDTDRPLTAEELRHLAAHPLASIGNHTSDHYLLDRYPDQEVLAQIEGGQQDLQQLLGQRPGIIAYPNGSYSQQTIDCARQTAGLEIGITVDKGKNYLPIDWQTDQAFTLRRFVLWGTEDISAQCDIFRSDIRI